MKTQITLLILIFLSILVFGQELKISSESSTKLDKDVIKDGKYAGTYLNSGRADVLYFMSSDEQGLKMFDYTFDNNTQFENFNDLLVSSEDAEKDYAWYLPKEKIEKMATGKERFLLAGAAFGSGMKIEFGTIKKNYQLGNFTDWSFEEDGKLKPKTDEIWRILPSGYKTTSDYDKLNTAYGFSQDLQKFGFPLLAPASATLLAAGVINEKVSIKNPPPTNGNRVAVLTINGEDFDKTEFDTYILPYSALVMASGLGQNDELSVLFAPLNAPSTVKEHHKYRWKDRQNYFTLMRFSDDRELTDSVSFLSKLMWGKFQVFNTNGASLITGLGKADFDGWARNADMIGLKKIDGVQVTKMKDDKLLYSVFWNEDELEEKLVVSEGVKMRYSLASQNNVIKEIIHLPNGDDLVLGQSLEETYALQVSAQGVLKAFYRIMRIDEKNSAVYNYQVMMKGDDMFLVLNEQPFELTNATQVNTSFSKGYHSSTKTTTVKRLNEVFVQSQLIKIDTKNLKMSNALIIDGKDYYSMGSFPALFTQSAIYFTGRQGPKGKTLHLLRVDI